MSAKAIVDRLVKGWETRDLQAILACFAEEAVWHNMPYPPTRGRAAIGAAIEGFLGNAEHVHFTIHNQWEVSPTVVVNERTDSFTMKGGRALDIPVMGVFETEGDLIVAWRDYFDGSVMGKLTMLELIPLCTAVVEVAPTLPVGQTPYGARAVSEITAVTVSGERLNGVMAHATAADWMVRAGDIGVIDVRMTIRTDDGALIYIHYGGRLDLSNPAAGINAYVAPVFETGDERYAWVNRLQAIGKGKLQILAGGAARIDYEFYEVR